MIGDLNQRATLLARSMTPDGGGGFSESWNAIATLWVKLEAQSGSDAFGPDATEPRTRYRVTLRRNADVAAGQRLGIGTRAFAINNLLDEGADLMTLLVEDVP
ncbi:MAG TPA: head-tail adaptor protein [Rhizomicrobium sp.]|jgi:head-tail adaptor|nr:head-tail adaptor protein [Rhizomicrobium sp.]